MAVVFIILVVILLFYLLYVFMAEVTVVLMYIAGIALVGYLAFNPHIIGRIWRRYVAIPDDDSIDGMEISMDNLKMLMSDLRQKLNQPPPLTLKGQEALNLEIEQSTKKIKLMMEQLNSIKNAGINIADFNAELVLHNKSFETLVESKSKSLDRALEISDLEHDNHKETLKLQHDRLESRRMEETERQYQIKNKMRLELEKEQAEIERLKAEIYSIRTEADVEKLKAQADKNLKDARTIREIDEADFISNVLSKIDPTKLPSELQAYIVANVFNRNTDSYDDYIMTEKLKVFMEKQAAAEAEKTEAEAEKIRSDARHRQMEADSIKGKNKYEKWKQKGARSRWN